MRTARVNFRIKVALLVTIMVTVAVATNSAEAREIRYDGTEVSIYVTPGEPTQVTFPSAVAGGFKNKDSNLVLDKQDNYLIVFAKPGLRLEGEAIIVQIDDKRTYALRVVPSTDQNPRDGLVGVTDLRPPMIDPEDEEQQFTQRSPVAELMRGMILVAEFGRQRGVPGYRRSNQHSGEVVLSDGTVNAVVDEIFMGSSLWGYVISVENLLGTTQKINPATFRLDGTRAISAERWELAAQPITDEQRIANQHRAKIYVITKAKRR